MGQWGKYENNAIKEMKESNIQNLSLVAGSQSGAMIWRNQVGTFYTRSGAPVKVGNVGAADSLGVVPIVITQDMVGKTIGVAIACEFKAKRGRQSDEQKMWQANFEKRGGKYALIRSPDQIVEFIEGIKTGQ
ncbi:MAG: hypothetical protein [Caudoviricetes sp.]|nr:MAG: hypothetical protein [Caudoviricetes sp.]